MTTRSRIRTSLGVSGGGLALVGLLASPALACFDTAAASTPVRTASVFYSDAWDSAAAFALTQAEFQAKLTAKLDAVAGRLAADKAQWSGVASGTVLNREQREAALTDLRRAVGTSWWLAKVPTTGALSASDAQQARIAALRSGLGSLAATLRGLLDNAPDRAALRQAKLAEIAARTSLTANGTALRSFTRDGGCDHHRYDGWGDGWGGSWDGSWGDGWDGRR